MIDQSNNEAEEILYRMVGPVITAEEGSVYAYPQDGILLRDNATFTRSDGSIVSRLYERLTKASRRRQDERLAELDHWATEQELWYRAGVYAAYKVLQEELKLND